MSIALSVVPRAINPERERAQALATLERLCALLDQPFDLGALRGVEAPPPEPSLPGWAGSLPALAAHLGLRVTPWSGSCVEAAAASRADLPLLTRGWSEWLVLGGRRFGHVEVYRPAREHSSELKAAAELARLLGVDAHEELEWLMVEPVAPATALLGGPSPEGGPAHSPFRRLRALLIAEREELGVILVYSVAVGLLALATPLAVQVLINTVAFASLRQPIVVLSLVLLACLALAAGLRGLQRYTVEVLQRRIFVRVVADLAWRLPRVRLNAFDRVHGPELVNRFFDVLTLQKAANALLLDGLGALLQAAVGLLLLALYHPLLLAFDLTLLAAALFLLLALGVRAPKTAIKESKAKYAVAGWLEELADKPLTFRGDGGPELALRNADELAGLYLGARESHFAIYFRQYVGMLTLQALAGATLLGVGGWLVVAGQLTLGQLVAAEIIVASALAGLAKFTDKLETFYDLLAALDKLGQLVDLPLERQLGLLAPETGQAARLELRGVSFERFKSPIRDLNLRVEPGERVSVLVQDGGGGELLAELCGGARHPDRGQVRLNDHDLAELNPRSARQQVALVRSPELVTGSVLDNVLLGRDGLTRREARQALRRVGLLQAVDRLPEAIDAELLPTGAPLSDHQLRRLALARAIVGAPRLLVLDGLLDPMPPAARATLLATLSAEPSWTLLLITAEPELAEAAPRQLALRGGVIVDAGAPPSPPSSPSSTSENLGD